MKFNIYNKQLETSFFLWADDYLLRVGEAYSNRTSALYPQVDPRMSNYTIYAAPFKEWNYNSNIVGSPVMNGVSGNFGTLTGNQSGLMVDYINGRVLLSRTVPKNLSISGTYSVKEFNLYVSNQTEEQIIFEDKYYLNSRFARTLTGIAPYSIVLPAIFITNSSDSENDMYALGGEVLSKDKMSMTIFAETMNQLDSALSVFKDAAFKSFPLANVNDDPINEFGSLKTGYYNYRDIINRTDTSNLIYISKVKTMKMKSVVTNQKDSVYVGFVDFSLEKTRFTQV